MSKEAFVFEVNQKTFEQYVMLNSHKIPVVVEFMGVWSGPSVNLETIYTDLAKEFAEEFIFAKVDIDEQPELRKEYKIENVPTTLVFQEGKLVRTEEGQLDENDARALLKDFGVYHESDLMREQARDKHLNGDTPAAILLLGEAIKKDPSNIRVVMDMIQVFIDINELEQANGLFARLPKTIQEETDMGQALNRQLTFANLAAKNESLETLQEKISNNPDDYDARFNIAVSLIAKHHYSDAADNLFHIFAKEPEFKEGAAKELLITISNMTSSYDSDLSQGIKRKMANLAN